MNVSSAGWRGTGRPRSSQAVEGPGRRPQKASADDENAMQSDIKLQFFIELPCLPYVLPFLFQASLDCFISVRMASSSSKPSMKW